MNSQGTTAPLAEVLFADLDDRQLPVETLMIGFAALVAIDEDGDLEEKAVEAMAATLRDIRNANCGGDE